MRRLSNSSDLCSIYGIYEDILDILDILRIYAIYSIYSAYLKMKGRALMTKRLSFQTGYILNIKQIPLNTIVSRLVNYVHFQNNPEKGLSIESYIWDLNIDHMRHLILKKLPFLKRSVKPQRSAVKDDRGGAYIRQQRQK